MTTTAHARAHNFSAGPAALPDEVLRDAQRDLLDLDATGIGILEHSHRGKAFDRVIDEAIADCRELAGIPDNYRVLFLQGGATHQFFMVPMNFLAQGQTADYLDTGAWSQKAIKEAKRFGAVHVACSSESDNFNHIPAPSATTFSAGARYCHFTSNNTIFGTEFHAEPATDAPLVCDASSDIFSRPIDITKYALLYAGAQKNLGPAGCALVIVRDDFLETANPDIPTFLRYAVHAEQDSRYNTPNTFAIYLMGRVFKWIKSRGGLEAIERANREKADLLYNELDTSDFYRATVADHASRSRMNVCFRCTDEALEPEFIRRAEDAGLRYLKGHRSVGGMRASIYNAVPIDAVRALIAFMRDFAKDHA